jgi:cytochrome P450
LPFFQNLAAQFGDLSYFRLGRKKAFFLNHSLITSRTFWSLITRAFIRPRTATRQAFVGEGLLTSEDEVHRRQRRLAQPAFHRSRIASYAGVMTATAYKQSARWQDGDTLDCLQR